MSRRLLLAAVTLTLCACSGEPAAGSAGPPSTSRPTASAAVATPSFLPSAVPTPAPTPAPPYAIDALRARPATGGAISVGGRISAGRGYATYAVSWPSQGGTMTGILHLPTGAGPFPVVVVNHGYVPVSQYYAGQDSTKYADALAAEGFLCLSPHYPGYIGSSPPQPGVPPIVAEAIADMDLIGALPSLRQADPRRVAALGHSNGGGVALILLAADPRIRSAVLFAPVSSDMADNARKWWVGAPGSTGGLPSPDADPDAYRAMSPRYHLPATIAPTLLMQGTDDEDIPAAWTADTNQALTRAGARTSFVSFAGATHNFRNADLVRANGLARDWLRASLG